VERGACHWISGSAACVIPQSETDCATSAGCKTHGKCSLAPFRGGGGNCVKADRVERARFPLTRTRNGIEGTLAVLLDSRVGTAQHPAWADYEPVGELAASLLVLRSADGRTLGQVEAFPVIAVQAEDLEDGTDTFLVSDDMFPAAGRCAGNTTTFFQVTGGRLHVLEAVGWDGLRVRVAPFSSPCSWWTLERRPDDYGFQIRYFFEGGFKWISKAQGTGPYTVERRYWYEGGRWRWGNRLPSPKELR
jgi:hypothetical protein